MSEGRLTELHQFIASTEIIIPAQPDLLDVIARGIRHLAADGSDPFHALGVLVEGAVHLLSTSVPANRRHEAAQAVAAMLQDRLALYGLV
jgi:hypothetical protein